MKTTSFDENNDTQYNKNIAQGGSIYVNRQTENK